MAGSVECRAVGGKVSCFGGLNISGFPDLCGESVNPSGDCVSEGTRPSEGGGGWGLVSREVPGLVTGQVSGGVYELLSEAEV